MEIESKKFNYEKAATIRDRIKALTQIQSSQQINKNNFNNADLIVAFQKNNITCIEVFFYRSKQNWGNQAFFPKHDKEDNIDDIIYSFLIQFYENKIPPEEIILSKKIKDLDLIKTALEKKYNKKINIKTAKNNNEELSIKLAIKNAQLALDKKLLENDNNEHFLSLINKEFNLGFNPSLIEVYDNSHVQGLNAVGAFVVFGKNGFIKKKYRKFNISKTNINPGDDYGMLKEVLSRRFAKIKSNNEIESPDLIVIDGGKGQLGAAVNSLRKLNLMGKVTVIGIAKRLEEIYFPGDSIPLYLDKRSETLKIIQHIRDEAHRFGITHHRNKRSRETFKTELSEIKGISDKTAQKILTELKSVKEIKEATLAQLTNIIGQAKAKLVYDFFQKQY